jgi:hypothetical protein
VKYLVSTRRDKRGEAPTALEAVAGDPDVTVVTSSDPNMVTIEADAAAAERLKEKLGATHFVEEEIRRGLH